MSGLKRNLSISVEDAEQQGREKMPRPSQPQHNPQMQRLQKFYDLERLIHQVSNGNLGNLGKPLGQVKDSVSRIVVWGLQSSGKSSLLNRICPTANLPERAGIGSLCPVEIRIGSEFLAFKHQVFQANTNSSSNFTTFEEAQAFVSNQSQGQLNKNCIIISEYPDPNQALTIVDMPGITANPQDQDYFLYMRNRYLSLPQTIILHVVRGDLDPGVDGSVRYLTALPGLLVKVLTHTDIWQSNPSSLAYLQQYALTSDRLALTNKSPEETQVFSGLDLKSDKPLMLGTPSLILYLKDRLSYQMQETLPIQRIAIRQAREALELEFRKIGRVKPDLRELVAEFRRYQIDLLSQAFDRNNQGLAVKSNQSRKAFTTAKLLEGKKLIPDVAVLAQELSSGSRLKAEGSEGWDEIVKYYSTKIIKQFKETISTFAESHMQKIIPEITQLFATPHRPATMKVQLSLRSDVADIVKQQIKEAVKQTHRYLDHNAHFQYDDSQAYKADFARRLYQEPLELALAHFYQSQNRATAVEEAYKDPRAFVEMLLPKLSLDPYLIKAKMAKAQLEALIQNLAVATHNHLIVDLQASETEVGKILKGKVERVEYDQLSEPEDIDTKRRQLVAIDLLCEEINKSL